MTSSGIFAPTVEAARARIAAIRPAQYARSRNAIEGAVSYLSPYITHGFVSLPDVVAGVASRYSLDIQHKLVYELGWREYFHHVGHHRGAGILQSLHQGVLPDDAYATQVPTDVVEGRTSVPVIDQAVRTLYATGYLHNHARMWLASYLVHLRKVHWRVGADWLIAHLLDGDLASNHLSWQWVAGTSSHKPYLFNAENVARYAPPHWHSPGTALDTSYASLESIAHQRKPVSGRPADGPGVLEPPRFGRPPDGVLSDPREWTGRDVWLVHPWALGAPPDGLPKDTVVVAWLPLDFHAAWPWSAARWAFVQTRMHALTSLTFASDAALLAQLLGAARSVETTANPHVSPFLPACVRQRAAPRLFDELEELSPSFSHWWNRSTRRVKQLADLPGLSSRLELQRQGHFFEDSLATPTLA